MPIGLATKLLRLCFIEVLLVSASASWALEPSLNAGDTRKESPVARTGSSRVVTCRFVSAVGAVQHQSTCFAEHLMPTFYRQIASCRGVVSCVLNVPSLTPIRLWSPDSRNQDTFSSSALPLTYTFQVFPRAAKATKGPWISAATQNTMVVRWETDVNASSWLRVVNDIFPSPHTARWIEGSSSCPEGVTQPCVHTAIVNGLNAGRRYRFVLGDVVPNTATGQHPGGGFVTEPVVGADTEYSFSVVGDVQQEGVRYWKDVGGYTAALQADTGRSGGPIFHTGDMVDWNNFFSFGTSMLSSHPFYPARGNNDNEELFKRYFGFTGSVNPTDNNLGKTYYSVNYGNTHIIVLDTSSLTIPCTNNTDEQVTWLRNDLKEAGATAAKNIVVVAHWGPRGYGGYGDNQVLKYHLESLFTDSSGMPTDFFRKLRMVFSGHQHYYERIIQAHTVGADTRKVHYVTVGTAGATPRCPAPGLEKSSAFVCSLSDGTYDYQGVVVDVRGRVFELRAYNFAYDDAGNHVRSVLDCFAIDENGESVDPQNSCNP
jgi:hypothetical protein